MTTFFEWLFGIPKSPEQIKQEIEENNEAHYREQFLKVTAEARAYGQKHKEIIEYRLRKPIDQVSVKELFTLGFNSNHLTRKHQGAIQ